MAAPLFYDATGKRRRWSMRARSIPQTAALRTALRLPPAQVFDRLRAIAGVLSWQWVGWSKLELNGRVDAVQSVKGV